MKNKHKYTVFLNKDRFDKLHPTLVKYNYTWNGDKSSITNLKYTTLYKQALDCASSKEELMLTLEVNLKDKTISYSHDYFLLDIAIINKFNFATIEQIIHLIEGER